jgi:pyridinium-3,5-biscarboxylic acid mononucleotide sulfurtransferase
MTEKYQTLLNLLKQYESVAVAFSGGVDSTFLLAAAKEALGDKVVAVIGRSPTYPKRELDEAIRLAESLGARCEIVDTNEMDKPEFAKNSPSRCFHCKTTLFETVGNVAAKVGVKVMLEGSNADDTGDYRPGMAAAKQLGVKAPLLEAGLTKDEIRALSKEMGLPTWNKPAMACLSSRIPYGEAITLRRLSRIEQAEYALSDLGLSRLRVRDHGDVARIEVSPDRIADLAAADLRPKIVDALTKAGYQYVCLDLTGYRTGAMNEVLKKRSKDG